MMSLYIPVLPHTLQTQKITVTHHPVVVIFRDHFSVGRSAIALDIPVLFPTVPRRWFLKLLYANFWYANTI